MPISRAPATQIVFNATGQHYRQTTSFTFLGGAVLKHQTYWPRWSFRCFTRELYDHLKASLPHLEVRIVKFEVVETLLYGCATWIPLKGHYNKLRTRHRRMLMMGMMIIIMWLRIHDSGASRRSAASSPTKTPSREVDVRVSKQPCVRGGCCGRGRCSAWTTTGYPRGLCRES